ncbi:MAG: hypothetical protein M1834_001697 [Cirrosporium novae-zelandiae]|nr:MAG: hypothetical protein M1834_001697 [Cirrosporium novae-zelandiae]
MSFSTFTPSSHKHSPKTSLSNLSISKSVAPKDLTYNTADAFLEALAEADVDYLFTVLGSDHASIIEAYIRRQKLKKLFPKMMVFLHEFTCISAADGFARITQKPACVIVHVDVGTAALGQGLHNASTGRAPILIFAGLAPYTFKGEVPGSRTEHVQWYQDVPNQASIIAPYSRYSAEIKSPLHVRSIVKRALLMATTGSPGPVYLTATREVLAEKCEPSPAWQKLDIPCGLGPLPEQAVNIIGTALLNAESPLIVTGYLGKDHQAVQDLVALADLVKGVKVLDSEAREMSFPANHRAWISPSTGAKKAIETADVILVIDCDVPWIPTKAMPKNATIFHIDLDPRKDRMQMFEIDATATYNADSGQSLRQLCKFISSSSLLSGRQEFFARRWDDLEKSHREGVKTILGRATASHPQSPPTVDYLFRAVREVVPEDTIFVTDAVTNQVPMVEQLQLTIPGSHISKGGSGLGWAGGASVGVKLGTELYDVQNRPNLTKVEEGKGTKFVCEIIGDGSFTFGAPTAVYWASRHYKCPFLTIIIDNGGWRAPRQSIKDVHPNGMAAVATNMELGISLEADGPDYSAIAKAAANGELFAHKVERAIDLKTTLRDAMKAIQEEKKGAVLDVVVKAPRL